MRIEFAGRTIADSPRPLRALETSHPPVFYLPPDDIAMELLTRTRTRTHCEFKGAAEYWTVTVAERVSRDAAWSYPVPAPGFEALRNHLAFYPSRVDACWVDDERVAAQEGDFYGGWITSDIVGPFKGGAGTWGW